MPPNRRASAGQVADCLECGLRPVVSTIKRSGLVSYMPLLGHICACLNWQTPDRYSPYPLIGYSIVRMHRTCSASLGASSSAAPDGAPAVLANAAGEACLRLSSSAFCCRVFNWVDAQ